MKKKINIGLDIGVASVGYSIIDEDNNILQLGVRLFDDVASAKDGTLKNATRRTKRESRRRIRRIATRKESFKKLLVKYGYCQNNNDIDQLLSIDITRFGVNNPVELKVKALKEKIPENQLLFILFHYLHHRGFFFITEDDAINHNIDLNILPSVELYNFYKENGYYKNCPTSNKYSYQQYLNEINQILRVNNYLNPSFVDKYIKLFTTIRDFSEGPGSEKSPTKYGLYRLDKNGKVEKVFENLWDGLVGKCTYYKNENRGAKNSPISEIFNLLNDFSNIYFYRDKDKKLTKQDKEKILNEYNINFHKNKDYKLSPIKLAKIKKDNLGYENITKDNVFGFRTKGDNAIITELKNYKLIFNFMLLENIIDEKANMWDINVINKAQEIFELLKTNDILKRKDNIKNKFPLIKDEFLELLISKKGVCKVMETHSLSYKAMNEYIDYWINNLDSNKNQMIFFNEIMIQNEENNIYNTKYLPHNIYQDAIISPTAKRALTQTTNVLNKILKKYTKEFDIDNITIELARDKNVAEEAKAISIANKKNEEIVKNFKKEFNIPEKTPINSAQKLRIKLWEQQERRDIYDNTEITFKEIMSGINLDIDHIIPYSIGADDSMNNKVLTHSYNNKDKSDNTPYQWLVSKIKFDDFEQRVTKLYVDKFINKEKYQNLVYKGDPSQHPEDFIGRNISDTRYASRLTLNLLQDFFDKKQDLYGHVKVKTVRGQLTNFARYNLFVKEINGKRISRVPKNRDLYCHHAIDASIICFLGMNHKTKLLLNKCNEKIKTKTMNNEFSFDGNKLIDNETGEVHDVFKILKYNDQDDIVKNFGIQLESYNWRYNEESQEIIKNSNSDKVLFSRMLTRKNNIPLSDETLYSVDWNKDKSEGNIITYLDLLGNEIKNMDKFFLENKDLNKIPLYNNQPNIFELLQTIYKQYNNGNSNPFIIYMKEQFNIEKPNFIIIKNMVNNTEFKIRKIKIIGDKITPKNTILLKKHGNKSILKSLKALSIRIYKNDNDKYVCVPINQKVLTYSKKRGQMIIDKDKLNQKFKEMDISNPKYIEINNGTMFKNKNTNELFYSNGGGSLDKNLIEIKCLSSCNEYIKFRPQMQISLSTIIENYNIIETDELGNIYKEYQIML